MATVSNFSTVNRLGIDVTQYYVVSASVTPEYPAPPFQLGQMVIGANDSIYMFVQASTTINYGDFVAITSSNQANSLTSTNVYSSVGARVGFVGPTVTQSLTYIPAGAYFWAQTQGNYVTTPVSNYTASPAGTLAAGNVYLYTSATGGVISSTSATTAPGLAGITVLVSQSTAINAVYMLINPRSITVFSSAGAQQSGFGTQP